MSTGLAKGSMIADIDCPSERVDDEVCQKVLDDSECIRGPTWANWLLGVGQ